ncbi:RcnB family protein [Phenylobacterium sp. J426]|uniref:RcnB family protein n=1 Tax=Phenylobacterium sp. J426 TaxID=2898439 RepID=UPI00215197CC|nr:RcnB family protein [Phenylobacterium sp. J426]MCR5875459.1 RcnB family protein [Phenylobacterium sp. J426]
MQRPILMFAAVLAVAASPIAADLAFAKDGRGQGGNQGRGRAEGPRGYERRGGDDGPRYERRGPPEGRGYERRGYERRGYDRRDDDRPPPGAYSGPRPGGWLPPEYRGPPVADYPRYRLRPPPAGYTWRRAGDAFVLTDREGRIFDVIPD